MMKICRLSHSINAHTPVYGGVDKPIFEQVQSISKGDSCNETYVKMKAHTSTHVDYPLHFVKNGKNANDWGGFFQYNNAAVVDSYIDDNLFFVKTLPEINNLECLIVNIPIPYERVDPEYYLNSPGMSIELTNQILKKYTSLKAIMMNSLSISSKKNREIGRKVHKLFLSKNILIFEDLNLKNLNLNIENSSLIISSLFDEKIDGSPVEILAIENEK